MSSPSSGTTATTKVTGLNALPTLPALEVEGRLPSGVIPTALLFADLKVKLNAPWGFLPQLGETDYFVVIWHVQGSVPFDLPAKRLDGPITAADFPLEQTIPQAYFQNNNKVLVSYRIHNLFEDSLVFETSSPVEVIFDRRSPGENQTLKAPLFHTDPISELDLSTNATLAVEVPGDYSGRALNDEALLYFMNSNALPTGLPIHAQVFAVTAGSMILNVPVAEFRKFAAFPEIYACYKLKDEAGNIGNQFSLLGRVALNLTPPVTGLLPPEVPAFEFKKLLVREDARNIVSFTVKPYGNPMAGDICIPELNGVKLAPLPVTSLPLSGQFKWTELIANGSDLQRKDNVTFRYYIRRAADLAGPGERSPLKLLNMDFTVFGRDHNLAPALLNVLLDLVNLFGAVSQVANRLDIRDVNLPVTASVVLPANPKLGDSLSLFFAGQATPVATYKVKPGDVGGVIVNFDNSIPWATVTQALGAGASLSAYYVTDNAVNQQQSASQSVTATIVPPINFPRPAFPQSLQHPNKYLACSTQPPIWVEVQIVVTPGTNVLPGDVVTVIVQGFLNYPDRNPIASTAHTISHIWGNSETAHTFLITDYENFIRPLSDFAGLSAKYSVSRKGALVGTSSAAYVQIDRKFAGSGKYCGPLGIGPK
ncbi:hypothetical protein [Pseudomonas tolaasii]|uniref:hypothetical protein n=2 Tax=Pseudomonas tolaasii TaxID=29442 RepID=UPI0021161EBF|nr:hypothetical protein [Pseudomonas tolaasii]